MIFVLSSLPPCAHVRIYIHMYTLLVAIFEKYFFRKFQSAVFLTFRPPLFSDRYQLMETMFCVFCWGGVWFSVVLSTFGPNQKLAGVD